MRLRLLRIIAAFILLLTGSVQAQERLIVKILPESSIKIKGQCSLGSYSFKYQGDLARVFRIPSNASNEQLLASIRALQLDVAQFSSGNFLMNKDFRKVMKTADFPVSKIELLSINPKNDHHGNGVSRIGVTIAGIRKEYLIPYQSTGNVYKFIISGSQPIRFNDFGLNPNEANKFIEIKDTCIVELNLVVQVDSM